MAIRPPVQVRHKHAMASVAHVQLAQRAVSQTPSGKETLRKKRLGKIRRGTRKRDRSISSSDGEVKDEKGDTLSVTCSDDEFLKDADADAVVRPLATVVEN